MFDEEVNEDYLMAFYDFLQNPPKSETLYQVTCKIWPVRPEICRTFPLHRQMLLKTGENDYRDERVLLEKILCPPHAFEKGGAKTAEYYFRQQLITNAEEVALAKIKATIQ